MNHYREQFCEQSKNTLKRRSWIFCQIKLGCSVRNNYSLGSLAFTLLDFPAVMQETFAEQDTWCCWLTLWMFNLHFFHGCYFSISELHKIGPANHLCVYFIQEFLLLKAQVVCLTGRNRQEILSSSPIIWKCTTVNTNNQIFICVNSL